MSNLEFALDLMRRLPPVNLEANLDRLCDLVPDLLEDLLASVDQPLKIAHDKEFNMDYLLCDYNRDGDSYRSPWSNEYNPPFSGVVPSAQLRALEVQINEAIDIYRQMYYEGGVSSVYLWDTNSGFAGVVLIKKTQDHSKVGQPMSGTWDSIHVVENESGSYKITSTIMLSIETETEATGKASLSGNLTRQEISNFPVKNQQSHIGNIGRIVENMENKLRQSIETIYFGKTKEVASQLRSVIPLGAVKARETAFKNIATAISKS